MRKISLTPQQKIAAIATLLIAVALVLLFVLVRISAHAPYTLSKADITLIDPADLLDPEEFIEPVLEKPGEQDAPTLPEPDTSPAPYGEPDKAPVPSDKLVTSGKSSKPNTSAERLVSRPDPSPVEATEPSKKDEPDSRIANELGGKFSKHNGTDQGKQTGTTGTSQDGTGVSASGTMGGGRSLISVNNRINARLSRQITLKVEVKVDDQGHSSSARCITPGVEASLKKKIENASNTARWTPKPGAAVATGTLTWTLRPKTY